MKIKISIILFITCIIFLSGCSNNPNIKSILENNNYEKKEYESGFSTYTKNEIMFTVFDNEKNALITYEDSDEITVTVITDNNSIFETYGCTYNTETNNFEGNCSETVKLEIKQAKEAIEKELKELELSYSDFNK